MTTQKLSDLKCATQRLMGAAAFSWGFCFLRGQEAQADCAVRTACYHEGDLRTGNQVAGKANYCCHFQLQHFQFRFDRPKKTSVFMGSFCKRKLLSVNNSLFPSFLLMTDLAEALGAGEVGEPRKYELKCSYTSFP